MNMLRHDDPHCVRPSEETKNVKDNSNVLGDVKIVSESKSRRDSVIVLYDSPFIH